MDDLDVLLSVIENPTRRRIWEALVREPHYPLQLSRELGLSQQGIMKHLKMLEDYHLVRSYSEDSDQGGPARKIYVPTTGITIMVDIGPGLFTTKIVTRALEEDERCESVSDADRLNFNMAIAQSRERISEIDDELEELGHRRTELIRAKEEVLNDICGAVESMVADYQVRRILYEYIQRPDLDSRGLARELGLRDDVVDSTIKEYQGDD